MNGENEMIGATRPEISTDIEKGAREIFTFLIGAMLPFSTIHDMNSEDMTEKHKVD